MKQSSGDNLQGYLNGERRTGCAHKGMYGECREINNMVFQSAGVEGQKTERQKLLNRCSKLILGTAADRGIRASLAGRKVIGPPRAPGPSLHLEQSTVHRNISPSHTLAHSIQQDAAFVGFNAPVTAGVYFSACVRRYYLGLHRCHRGSSGEGCWHWK